MKKLLLTCMALMLMSATWISPVFAGFKDVDDNNKYNWAKSSIHDMNLRGILTGFPDGTFRPDQPVTKAEFTVMVYRLFPLLRNPGVDTITIPWVPENHWASREFAELYSTT
ncbi:S-layer homology domain-containing protein [Paenibacillus sp. D2_2]|uniref:S-layer homology domain-containing protein n=1 Tax=Paenibacillus sp. D2_2 TaxID=3073092 RepID=UPI002814CC47|nr:S-layer homology domain-containing protein [Paenibacillus sp. D2_2]WMT43309.1 S-layer homology domain-containing protein [Paenibacillus sp. D2_2]